MLSPSAMIAEVTTVRIGALNRSVGIATSINGVEANSPNTTNCPLENRLKREVAAAIRPSPSA
jgi:hypothetical protein